jgi:hypothetical protein
MKSPMTCEKYKGRLPKFFDFIGLTQGPMVECAKTFIEMAKKEPDWLFVGLLRFAQAQKKRVKKGELSAATLRNYI